MVPRPKKLGRVTLSVYVKIDIYCCNFCCLARIVFFFNLSSEFSIPVTFVVNLFKRPTNYFRLTPSVDRLTDMILKLYFSTFLPVIVKVLFRSQYFVLSRCFPCVILTGQPKLLKGLKEK